MVAVGPTEATVAWALTIPDPSTWIQPTNDLSLLVTAEAGVLVVAMHENESAPGPVLRVTACEPAE